MRLYVDDDSTDKHLLALLRQAGHDVQVPTEVSLSGAADPIHLTHGAAEDRVVLSGNHKDFQALHDLIVQVRGHYPGILIVRRDNDPNRDLRPAGVVRAIRNLLAANVPIVDQLQVLNQWR